MRPDTSIYYRSKCTGKTTLVNALFSAFYGQRNDIVIHGIPEVARTILLETGITRDGIANDPWKAPELQKLILRAQYDAKSKQSGNLVLSDRFGIDALVYAARYGPLGCRGMLQITREWQYLRSLMMQFLQW
ncbi:hypothetical protein BDV24DRAFT_154611 [Aspergillus arachidicola]|uniref:NadR/Ttd14 AAA domain-containing protein n=1 Tax=Aspergillus arachidicola TaxID=656916 RepID=A0A5N6XWZ3_9EURO|nr:hypothetical protein BDV24DRAFT_154611 [Aspergillus arachidicola]